jgi:membrane-associated protein
MNINDILHFDFESVLAGMGPVAMALVCLVVFVETGLFIGVILPGGDSLLFAVGVMIGSGVIDFPIWLACIVISISAVLGDQLGYWIGRKAGPAIFKRPDSRVFHKENAVRAEKFFIKYGAKAVIFAHFVPIMRTFIPIAAGVGKMRYGYYLRYNIIGALSWGIIVPLIGYFLGNIQFVRENVIIVTLALVSVSFIPVLLEIAKARREKLALKETN